MELIAIIKSFVTLFSIILISAFAVSYFLFRIKSKKRRNFNSSPNNTLPQENNKSKNIYKKPVIKQLNFPTKKSELRFKVINNINQNFEAPASMDHSENPADKIRLKRLTTLK